jgi:fructose-1,6-bisphosphatase
MCVHREEGKEMKGKFVTTKYTFIQWFNATSKIWTYSRKIRGFERGLKKEDKRTCKDKCLRYEGGMEMRRVLLRGRYFSVMIIICVVWWWEFEVLWWENW